MVQHYDAQEIRDGLYLLEAFRRHGIEPDRGMQYLAAHLKPVLGVTVAEMAEGFLAARARKGTGPEQLRHLRLALRAFVAAMGEDKSRPELVTEADCVAFLARWEGKAAKTWNEQLGYLHGLWLWSSRRGYVSKAPTAGIARLRLRRVRLPAVLAPERVERLLCWLEHEEPDWVPYHVFAVFSGLRPDVRGGEARRLDEDLLAPMRHLGVAAAVSDMGFFVRGKTGGRRHVGWEVCGPLRAWLAAYPVGRGRGLIPPGLTYAQAERRLHAIRRRFGLSHDVLRHTAASAMVHAPGASFAAVAMALDNSERMLRQHYIGLWDEARTRALWSLLPERRAPWAKGGGL